MASSRRGLIIACVITALVLAFASIPILPRLLAARESPEPAVADVAAKADAFTDQVDQELDAKAKAAAEAKLVKLAFPKDRPLRVFFAGDSLGASFYSSVRDRGYRPLMIEWLEKSGPLDVTVATKQASEALFQVGNVQGIPASGLDLAVIELGTNDAGRTELPDFKKQYEDLLAKIQRGSPKAGVICAGAWGLPGSKGTDPYDQVIKEVCEARGGKYVDLTDAFMQEGTYGPKGVKTWAGLSDNFHPNDKGHRIIAGLLLDRIALS